PGRRPLVLEQPGRLAAVDAGADGVGRGRREQRGAQRRGLVAERVLLRCQPERAHPYADGAERQRGDELTSRTDAAGRQHGYVATDGVDDLRDQHHAGDLPGVPARFVALRYDDVHALADVPLRVLSLAGERGHRDALAVSA